MFLLIVVIRGSRGSRGILEVVEVVEVVVQGGSRCSRGSSAIAARGHFLREGSLNDCLLYTMGVTSETPPCVSSQTKTGWVPSNARQAPRHFGSVRTRCLACCAATPRGGDPRREGRICGPLARRRHADRGQRAVRAKRAEPEAVGAKRAGSVSEAE